MMVLTRRSCNVDLLRVRAGFAGAAPEARLLALRQVGMALAAFAA